MLTAGFGQAFKCYLAEFFDSLLDGLTTGDHTVMAPTAAVGKISNDSLATASNIGRILVHCGRKGAGSVCSRYSLTAPPETVRAMFGLRAIEPFPPRFNIAPTQPVHIIRPAHDGSRQCVLVRWGLIPSWVRDPSRLSTLINARAETLAEKPSFRGAIRHKRCLVPATGYYEWTGRPGRKQPHLIRRPGTEVFAFAGLFEQWMGADGSEMDSMAIITVPANAAVRAVHERMPAILEPEQFDAWLDCRSVETRFALDLLQPAPDGLLEIQPVSTQLNNPRNDGPELWQPDRPTLL